MFEWHVFPLSARGAAVKAKSSTDIIRDILKKLPKTRRYNRNRLDWDKAERKKLRVTLRVPFVYRLFNVKRNLMIKAKCVLLSILFKKTIT